MNAKHAFVISFSPGNDPRGSISNLTNIRGHPTIKTLTQIGLKSSMFRGGHQSLKVLCIIIYKSIAYVPPRVNNSCLVILYAICIRRKHLARYYPILFMSLREFALCFLCMGCVCFYYIALNKDDTYKDLLYGTAFLLSCCFLLFVVM